MSKCRKNGMLLAWSAAIGIWGCVDTLRSAEGDVTVVTITDQVLVKDCTPFGVNLNGRNLLKKHVEVNFEGSSHRVCLNGELFRDGFLCYTVGAAANKTSQLDKHWPGGTILWQEYKLSFDLREKFSAEAPAALASGQTGSTGLFVVEGGTLLLDDIAISFEGDKNPTPFRDDIVDVLRASRVGVLRLLQEGGDTMVNTISPRMRQHSYDGSLWTPKGDPSKRSWFSGQRHYTLHELFTLCEHLGCEPWYCLPGTLYPEEIDVFMEYVGAPPDVGYGKLRAAQGHPKPWTETLRRIHVEFGNEIWNFVGEYKVSSYDGPDYWEGMIRRAKKSPYYSNNVIFVMGTDSKLEHVRNADRVMRRAPYVIHDLPQEELDRHATREDLYRWVFGYTLLQNVFGDSITELSRRVHEAGQELAVYEVNWLLSGDTLTASNEFEVDRPQATLTHTQIERFKTGHRLTLPPHSMTAVQWHTD